MSNTRSLREEHQVILGVLDCFEVALSRARADGVVTSDIFAPFVEFFRGFADRCHHCKEEDELFPCLNACGMPRDVGPIAVMLHEHRIGRAHVRAIAESLPAADTGDAAARQAVLQHGFAFLEMLRNHIFKEDHVLFDMADQMVEGSAAAALADAYRAREGNPDYQQTHDRCARIARELRERYGSAARGTSP